MHRTIISASSFLFSVAAGISIALGSSAAAADSTATGASSFSTAVQPTSIAAAPIAAVPAANTINLIRVPLTRQATNYTCGVSALQSVLAYYGDEIREDTLSKTCKSNRFDGTHYRQIKKFAESKGYKVIVKTDAELADLQALLDQKLPVICLIQAWSDKPVDYSKDWADGHYVVAVGYDASNIYFMDPSTIGHYTYIPRDEFLKRWHDVEGTTVKLKHFTMAVSKPNPVYDGNTITKLQ